MIPISLPQTGESEILAIKSVLDSGQLVQGIKTAEFERRFAEFHNVDFAVATSSGTTALITALLANGIVRGDEVIVPSFTFIASAGAIASIGAVPVFADIEVASFNIDPADVERHITDKTKAIMPVHLFGNPCDMARIMDMAEKHKLRVIEDACQAHGASVDGKMVGSFGTGCFSFYASKNMTTCEGGMVTTNSREIADWARTIRSHGENGGPDYILGGNYRMSEIHAAIGLVQLTHLEKWNTQRNKNACYLSEGLKNVVPPAKRKGVHHVFHQYTVRKQQGRNDAIANLQKAGIQARIYYETPLHLHPSFRYLNRPIVLPVTERLCKEVFSLPVHPGLSKADLDQILSGVADL